MITEGNPRQNGNGTGGLCPWPPLASHACPLLLMASIGSPGFQWLPMLPMAPHRSPWIAWRGMASHGPEWLPMSANGFAWLHMLTDAFPEVLAAPHRALQDFVANTARRPPRDFTRSPLGSSLEQLAASRALREEGTAAPAAAPAATSPTHAPHTNAEFGRLPAAPRTADCGQRNVSACKLITLVSLKACVTATAQICTLSQNGYGAKHCAPNAIGMLCCRRRTWERSK
jgi:hypothetical protein